MMDSGTHAPSWMQSSESWVEWGRRGQRTAPTSRRSVTIDRGRRVTGSYSWPVSHQLAMGRKGTAGHRCSLLVTAGRWSLVTGGHWLLLNCHCFMSLSNKPSLFHQSMLSAIPPSPTPPTVSHPNYYMIEPIASAAERLSSSLRGQTVRPVHSI